MKFENGTLETCCFLICENVSCFFTMASFTNMYISREINLNYDFFYDCHVGLFEQQRAWIYKQIFFFKFYLIRITHDPEIIVFFCTYILKYCNEPFFITHKGDRITPSTQAFIA